MGTGTVAVILFHLIVHEKPYRRNEQLVESTSNRTHCGFLRQPLMYQVAGVYMTTRLVVNVSQVLIPLYLHRTLGLAARALAVVPLAMYLGSLAAAGVQRLTPRSITRKLSYLTGSACALTGFMWVYFGSDHVYKHDLIYVVAVLIGFGGAVMLVTSLALTADLVGARTEASAFVYGLMSFTDKLACGVAIALIQLYADGADATYYRDALSWVCGGACTLGLVLTLLLPKFNQENLINDNSSVNSTEDVAAPLDI
uniref:Major facilitator superfamily (MFS) profile domain-containing protein n=2 Tax=Pectinophora gossypiella TaxID=13191 RepID=A0A1E1WKA0_PECGO